jgi:hypothetical protein
LRIHIVRGRETLWELAKQYNVPVARILKANPQLTENQPLATGSKVRIPSGKVPVSQAQRGGNRGVSEEKVPVTEQGIEEQPLKTPNIAVDPDAFFLEQEEPDQADLYQEGYPPSMPYHLPPYPSFYPYSFGPYSWVNAPGPMYPYGMPFAPMPPCGCRPPAHLDESSSYQPGR